MKWAVLNTALLLAAPALAQTTAAPLVPSPTESTGCHLHGDHWHCDGPATGAATAAATAAAHDDHDHDHEEEGHDHAAEEAGHEGHDHEAEEAAAAGAAPSPTESTGCHLHGDHWHCDGPASATATAASPDATPTGRGKCTWHETHWDCEKAAAPGSAEAEHDAAFESSGECVIHGECFCALGGSMGTVGNTRRSRIVRDVHPPTPYRENLR